MQIKDIIGLKAKLVKGNLDAELTNLSKDTRTILKGETYIGLKGENFDGSTFYQEAILKGAKTCILNDIELDQDFIAKHDVNIIITDNTNELLIRMAEFKRKTINIPIIAITGSVGKTSTKNMIAQVLSSKYKVLKTKGNLNTVIGLCLTLLSLKDEEIIVLEMGMNNFGEIQKLTNIAKPTIAVITNIGTAHIGNLGSRENILKAKLEILEGLQGPIFINNDNDLLHNWQEKAKIDQKIITYGLDNQSDFTGTNLTYSKNGSSLQVDNVKLSLNVLGKHFIYNALVAYAIAKYFNLDNQLIQKSLSNIMLEPDRLEIINKSNYTIINDTYNSSYDSVYYALEVLSHFNGPRLAVLGDILELGDYAKEIHQKIGKLIPKFKIDILITVGENALYINEAAIKNGFNKNNSYHFNSNIEAVKCINDINNKATILIKASNGMHFKEIVTALK